jgi:hypothetical protein
VTKLISIYAVLLLCCCGLWPTWAIALSKAELGLIELSFALAVTLVLCLFSSTVITKLLSDDRSLSAKDIKSGAIPIAIVAGFMGLYVLASGQLPSKRGPVIHAERRFSVPFFVVAIYLVVTPLAFESKEKP